MQHVNLQSTGAPAPQSAVQNGSFMQVFHLLRVSQAMTNIALLTCPSHLTGLALCHVELTVRCSG